MEYIEQILDIKIEYKDWEDRKKIPFFLIDRYSFKQAKLDETNCLFMYIKGKMEDIVSVKKHVQKLAEIVNIPVVLVLDECLPRQRESLIKARIPFVMEGTQIFLPFMGVALQEKFSKRMLAPRKISPAAQVLFLYFLYSGKEEISLSELSNHLSYSLMTISRATKQLEDAGIIKSHKRGVSKFVTSEFYGKELFTVAEKVLISPVKKKLYIERKDLKDEFLKAGISALSEYSMLSPSKIETYATMQFYGNSYEFMTDIDKEIQLEIWHYDSKLFGMKGKIDALSLYLSLKDNADERIQISLTEMMEEFWRKKYDKRLT